MFDTERVYKIQEYSNYYVKNGILYSEYTKRPVKFDNTKTCWLSENGKVRGTTYYNIMKMFMGEDYIQMKQMQLKKKYNCQIKRIDNEYLALRNDDDKKFIFSLRYNKFLNFHKNDNGYLVFSHNGKSYLIHKLKVSLFVRQLNQDEIIHHQDFNTLNNSFDNLVIMDKKKHYSLHNTLKRYQKLKREIKKFVNETKKVNYISNIQININKILDDFNNMDNDLKNIKNTII